jgi:hypothetical protein
MCMTGPPSTAAKRNPLKALGVAVILIAGAVTMVFMTRSAKSVKPLCR